MSFKNEKILHEIIGIILLSISIFLILCLISYSPNDPSWNLFQKQRPLTLEIHKKALNYIGPVGAGVAEIMFGSLGLPVFFIPLILFIIGWSFLWTQPIENKIEKALGAVILIISVTSLLAIFTIYSDKPFTLCGLDLYSLGGWVGEFFIQKFFLVFFGRIGSYILLFTTTMIAIILITHISFASIIKAVTDIFGYTAGLLWRRSSTTYKRETENHRDHRDKDFYEKKKHKAPRRKSVLRVGGRGNENLLPPHSLLIAPQKSPIKKAEMEREIEEKSRILEQKLLDFSVQGRVAEAYPGPVITRYDFEPAPGIKINRISNLSDDLALGLKALSIRIVAPVPGKAVVGIEIPNSNREMVSFEEILTSREVQSTLKSKLSLALGKDISGHPYVTDLARMPHLLVAGATGSGKSVCVNTIICSILFHATYKEVKFIMIDPKRLELGIYNDIPHLLVPVVTEPKKAANALRWATEEMDRRYQILAEKEVRNLKQYNDLVRKGKIQGDSDNPIDELPFIVIVIDEFADLMILSGREVETMLTRLAQMARAVGIHIVIATQRPSVDVITGIIKANFPSRISFRVSSKTDSRTILDCNGAEKLLGMGDMLFIPPGSSEPVRLHGSAISEAEIKGIVDFLINLEKPFYDTSILEDRNEKLGETDADEYDELYDQAVDWVIKTGQASISMIQRKMRIGYNRAARMIELMEKEGVVSKPLGSKGREVLAGRDGLQK
ncbi:MAG: DNA translocase FtsK [bacterium]